MALNWINISATLLYFLVLLGLAVYGDRRAARFTGDRTRRLVYVLGLCVYCTSWTFFGSVGLASTNGLDFLPIYIGPMLVFGFGWPLVARVARTARAQNTTSIADFLAARYGKSEAVAAVAAVIAVIGVLPYIALQLKAISATLMIGFGHATPFAPAPASDWPDRLALGVAILLALFAMAFGTRRVDAGEHQNGLMVTIAAESMAKLLAFLVVGGFVVWGMFGGLGDLFQRAAVTPGIRAVLTAPPDLAVWTTLTLLSSGAMLFLPRQFHVAIVENRDENDIKTAAVVFPLYLLAINFFVVPLAVAGLLKFPIVIDRDLTVMALPLAARNAPVAFIAMIGGLSAATAMVVVESVALSVMASNNLVLPLLLRIGRWRNGRARPLVEGEAGLRILRVRRAAILVVLLLSFFYYRLTGETLLASIGILSFACVAQFGPAFVGALLWRRGTALGAIAGLITGVVVWVFTLLIPSIDAGLAAHPAAAASATFKGQMDTLVHGVFWSLTANSLAYVVFSLARRPTPIERLQAEIFVGKNAAPMAQAFRLWRASVQASEVETTVARYLGAHRTREAFEAFFAGRGQTYDPRAEADIHLMRIAEHLLASAIGAASARLVLSLLLKRRNVSSAAAIRLVDDASAALLYNRDMLQHALDFTRQGISVFDADLRLTCWNREFRDMFSLPAHFARNGVALDDILRFNAERGLYGEGAVDELVLARLERLTNSEPFRVRLTHSGKAIETRSARMPDGGLVVTYTDVTDQFAAEQALEASKESLEQRVRERTEELTRLNEELARAKADAERANISKTRFLAAAGHDILQPLNAARLYAATMLQRAAAGAPSAETGALARNVDSALEAVEDIFSALLEMSRLDAGAMKVELSNFRVDELFRQLKIEFAPLAEKKGLKLIFTPCSLAVRSDRRLLRRLLQNLVSNAVKYTRSGRVLVGARRLRGKVRIEVWDTGLGIPREKQKSVFREFERLDAGGAEPGLGLGLSIVERMARVLAHPLALRSSPGKGSVFTVTAPFGAPPPHVSARDAPAAAPRQSQLVDMAVLAIDNDPLIVDGMRALLASWGCVPIVATSQREAIAELARQKRTPDAILADYHLDEGDGVDAIVALRWRFGASVPAALITADRSEEMRARAREKDVMVINKPLKPATLRALLAQWRAAAATPTPG
ncbi:PAS-domain containing protein [Rhodoblastus acidophilus]|uniref:histidine kinase n=1 Tax=Candidatus Rhodoblastus alkanivorans TaxID=2954117 RepID=A0ABS9ZDV4_9HYPH|nr:NahK/ErcS family hybrid sensor histidine kinase/response regulator [Candidatus Rhodoblastus alkanivorans]MCI4677225.1 PAS-domain containing protein [Candidatus Rhodoblastus alkanivorans]MCI4684577.1 PAS-domain containing protein [Candidatus Rhodoblastus alkanivorans]MDI4641899.1 PAS-domain containing protein [Rhodoblastus acidophilus]